MRLRPWLVLKGLAEGDVLVAKDGGEYIFKESGVTVRSATLYPLNQERYIDWAYWKAAITITPQGKERYLLGQQRRSEP